MCGVGYAKIECHLSAEKLRIILVTSFLVFFIVRVNELFLSVYLLKKGVSEIVFVLK
jgi:hypothetical protein